MDMAGPFEDAPMLVVGVSGGADSMALVLAAQQWAVPRRGRVAALTINHGLRPDAEAEADQVRAWLGSLDIEHHVLTWTNPMPSAAGVQARARMARYDLIEDWCRARGILHVLLGHHVGDQAETIAMRRARQSSGRGLAGMALASERAGVRLIRPFLSTEPGLLRERLRTAGQAWIEDPSNNDPRFERVRVRHSLDGRNGSEIDLGINAGVHRIRIDENAAHLMAGGVRSYPSGFLTLERKVFASVPEDAQQDILARMVQVVSGAPYRPRHDRVARLVAKLLAADASDATLGGCRVLVRAHHIFVIREMAATAPAVRVSGPDAAQWDGRFRLRYAEGAYREGDVFGPLGSDGWRQCREWPGLDFMSAWPAAVRETVPAIFRDGQVVWVAYLTGPHFGAHPDRIVKVEALPIAAEPLNNSRFFVASRAE